VKDYGRYPLRRPPHGQHWVRVDNQYLLVGITSGIIGALVNAQ
jgi:Ni/Co efflux regulator RcnB